MAGPQSGDGDGRGGGVCAAGLGPRGAPGCLVPGALGPGQAFFWDSGLEE